jgi:hypothetical protein
MEARPDLRVECYAGSRGEERPLAFWLGDRRLAIRTILDAWQSEDGTYFRIIGGDRVVYVLRRDDRRGQWELTESGSRARQDGTT